MSACLSVCQFVTSVQSQLYSFKVLLTSCVGVKIFPDQIKSTFTNILSTNLHSEGLTFCIHHWPSSMKWILNKRNISYESFRDLLYYWLDTLLAKVDSIGLEFIFEEALKIGNTKLLTNLTLNRLGVLAGGMVLLSPTNRFH